VAFRAQELIEIGEARKGGEDCCQFDGDLAEVCLLSWGGVAGAAQEHLAAVLDLSGYAAAGDLQPS
jgi:hypothetical protein